MQFVDDRLKLIQLKIKYFFRVNIPYTTPGPRSKKPRIEMGLPVASEPEVNNDQSTVVENGKLILVMN